MSLDADILTRVLDLPDSEHAELARRLLLSLEPPDFDLDAEQFWAAEIQARLERLDRGESVPVEWRPAIERVRVSLGQELRS